MDGTVRVDIQEVQEFRNTLQMMADQLIMVQGLLSARRSLNQPSPLYPPLGTFADAQEVAARYEARRDDFAKRLGQIIDAFRAEWVGDTEAVREYVMGHIVAVQQAADLANQND